MSPPPLSFLLAAPQTHFLCFNFGKDLIQSLTFIFLIIKFQGDDDRLMWSRMTQIPSLFGFLFPKQLNVVQVPFKHIILSLWKSPRKDSWSSTLPYKGHLGLQPGVNLSQPIVVSIRSTSFRPFSNHNDEPFVHPEAFSKNPVPLLLNQGQMKAHT